jgi:MSHA pilin protein MshD
MSRRRCAGFSLVEVVVFIVVLGLGIAAIAVLYNRLTLASVDPLVRKQALAIASSLMEEIQLRAFTTCDPDDANVFGPGPCVVTEGPGPEAGETRTTFDNVNDYHGFQMGSGTGNPVTTAGGVTVDGMADYLVTASIAESALAPVAAADSLLVTVTATHVPSGTAVTLQGYRTRYAPNNP